MTPKLTRLENQLFLFIGGLTIFPLFLLTLKGWMNYCLVIMAVLSIFILVKYKASGPTILNSTTEQRWLYLFAIALAAPIMGTLLGQMFRQTLIWKNYDSPSRMLISIPILWVIIKYKLNALKFISYSIPLSILITLASSLVHPDLSWGTQRIKTYFVDPLTFGSLNLTLGIFCILSIDVYKQDTVLIKLYKLAGFAAGLYLSLLSGSRTGWMSLPIVLFLWLQLRGAKFKFSVFFLSIAIATLACIAIYYFSEVAQNRINLAANEAMTYHWHGMNNNTSAGMRISFYRIGWFLFLENPWGGWGDQGFKHLLNAPELTQFATQFTREFVYKAGFHNEIVTNMVRSGVWGMFSSCAVLFIPAICFARHLRSNVLLVRKIALLSFCYTLCTLVSGMSNEVFNLKFTASFHAMMFVCLAGSLWVALLSSEPEPI